MEQLGDYLKDEKRNNIIMQLALREIDEQDLVAALAGLEKASVQAVYRNLSKRAAESIGKELEKQRASLDTAVVNTSLTLFMRLLAEKAKMDLSGY